MVEFSLKGLSSIVLGAEPTYKLEKQENKQDKKFEQAVNA
jgi:hypothetical protein